MHIGASKERILEEYKKKYKLGELIEIPRARINRPLASANLAAPPSDHPASPKKFGKRDWRLLNKRSAVAVPNNNNRMDVVKNRPAEAELPPQTNTFVDTMLYIKLKGTHEIIFVLRWGVFIRQYQFKDLDNCMSKLKKNQNVNKSA